ncbi:MAG: hypothetical protein MJ176_00805 [Treponema sp.]|nr:hypothetical protein [Treponema sp.]
MSETKNSEKDFDIPQALCLQCRLLMKEKKRGFVLFHTRNTPKKFADCIVFFTGKGLRIKMISERRFLRLYQKKYKTQCVTNEN